MHTRRMLMERIDAALASADRIRREDVRKWMQSPDIGIQGAVADLVTYQASWERITPPLTREELESFLFPFYERCLREDPREERALSRYDAAREIVGWFRAVPKGSAVGEGEPFLHHLRSWLGNLYRDAPSDVREAIVTGALEHILEEPRWRVFFESWRDDPSLRGAYEEAMRWAEHHTLASDS